MKKKVGEPGCFFRAALAVAAGADEPAEQWAPACGNRYGAHDATVGLLLIEGGTTPMIMIRDAVFGGDVLRPEGHIPLEPNTRVRITVEAVRAKTGMPYCSLHAMLAAHLDGPPDWSEGMIHSST